MQQFIDGIVLNDVFTVGLRNLKKNMSTKTNQLILHLLLDICS